jgi:hypothetical protein
MVTMQRNMSFRRRICRTFDSKLAKELLGEAEKSERRVVAGAAHVRDFLGRLKRVRRGQLH